MDGHDGEQGDAEPGPTQDRFQHAGGSGFDTRAEPCDDVQIWFTLTLKILRHSSRVQPRFVRRRMFAS
jgi:hypothetical protein